MNVNFCFITFVLVTRTLADAKRDARTFSHAKPELSGVKTCQPHSVTLLHAWTFPKS